MKPLPSLRVTTALALVLGSCVVVGVSGQEWAGAGGGGGGGGGSGGSSGGGGGGTIGPETNPGKTDLYLGSNKQEALNLTNVMNFRDCHEFKPSITGYLCILMGKKNTPDNICKQAQVPISCIISYKGTFEYWEPSELIEVSCRKGSSMLMPNGVGQIPRDQSCYGQQGKKAQRWFFDVRNWAINGDKGQAREQSAGSTLRKQAAACGLNAPAGGPIDAPEGYGKKHNFSKGGGNGPGGSWEAYISDYDASWATDGNNQAVTNQPTPQACTSTNVENCWGNIQPYSGWVVHPHRPVAAALIAWRSHNKAGGKVSASPAGFKMEMDYPYIMSNSFYGQTHGLTGGQAGGGTRGSKCFQPGDPGPWWFNNQQEGEGVQAAQVAEKVQEQVNKLHQGDITQQATVHTGTYIFTVWVKTKCTLYAGMAGTNVQQAINGCADKHDL